MRSSLRKCVLCLTLFAFLCGMVLYLRIETIQSGLNVSFDISLLKRVLPRYEKGGVNSNGVNKYSARTMSLTEARTEKVIAVPTIKARTTKTSAISTTTRTMSKATTTTTTATTTTTTATTTTTTKTTTKTTITTTITTTRAATRARIRATERTATAALRGAATVTATTKTRVLWSPMIRVTPSKPSKKATTSPTRKAIATATKVKKVVEAKRDKIATSEDTDTQLSNKATGNTETEKEVEQEEQPPTPARGQTSAPVLDDEEWIKKQQCNIPRLDPFHKAVRRYIGRTKATSCKIERFSKVSNGVLYLKLRDVQSVGLHYIRRYADVWGYLSNYNSIVSNGDLKGQPGCIRLKKDGRQWTLKKDERTGVKYITLSNATNNACADENMFVITNNTIRHKDSSLCVLPQTCKDKDKGCRDLVRQGECETNYTYMVERCKLSCNLCDTVGNKKSGHITNSSVSCGNHRAQDCEACPQGNGRSWCNGDCFWCNVRCQPKGQLCDPQEKILLQLSSPASSTECLGDKFTIEKKNRFMHAESKKCIRESTSNDGYLVLGSCKDATNLFQVHDDMIPKTDVDIKYPLKEELVKVVFVYKRRTYTEYHIAVLKTDKEKLQSRYNKIHQSDMNIALINFDSQSRANIQRQWTNTYDFLTKDEHSVILKGLVINGDATTENLSPLLTGYAVKDLPEARKWKKGWGYLNRWPFIFKDLHWANYKTAYSEDDPGIGAFYYRVSGFKEQPTDKYISPWFAYNKKHSAPDCTVKYTLNYLKDFLTTYYEDKKFAMGILSRIGHDDLNQIHLSDDDMLNFFQFLNDTGFRHNTTVLVFGDHGFRNGGYRSTMQGKLEERLPFLSISLPSWYKDKYPSKMKNLKRNSEVLTSWFDIHQTLRHLMWPKNYTKNRPIGRSLFTDVVSLNRTCEECGIPVHYCVCLVTTKLPNNDMVVIEVAQYVVRYINQMIKNITKASELCSEVLYDEVIHAHTIGSNKQVQRFRGTYETSQCDRCGASLSKSFKLSIVTYGVLFKVKNFGGLFEATVEVEGASVKSLTKNMKLSGEISRIDRYGDQPKCVAKEFPILRKFCFCKDYVGSS